MNIVVCVKWVPDQYGAIRYDPREGALKTEGVPFVINPTDELALEQALQLKDSAGGQVTAICLSANPGAEERLRYCLAVGADRAWLLCDPAFEAIDAYVTGLLLAEAIRHLEYQVVFCGIEAADDNSGLVWAVIAEALGLPSICGITYVSTTDDKRRLVVHKIQEGGNKQVIESELPVLLVTQSGPELRYPSLRSRLAASKAAIERRDLAALGLSAEVASEWKKTQLLKFSPPRPRMKGLIMPDSSLSAVDRMYFLMSGGITAKEGNRLTGEPREIACQLADILTQRKLLT